MVKVRRVGSSNVISLPRDLEELGFRPDTQVMLRPLPNGEGLLVIPANQIDAYIDRIAAQVIEEERPVLERLAAYDRGETEG